MAENTIKARITIASQTSTSTLVPKNRELIYLSDQNTLKIGNGSSTINSLAYMKGKMLGGSSWVRFTVDGDKDKYYPVLIASVAEQKPYQILTISRDCNATAPSDWGTDSNHKGGLTWAISWNGDSSWGGNGTSNSLRTLYLNETYCKMASGMQLSTQGLVVWLRGGTADYWLHCINGIAARVTVYLDTYTDTSGTNFKVKTSVTTPTVQGFPAGSLTTDRTLWGQSFNGTQDVSGNMTNVGMINGVFQPLTNTYVGKLFAQGFTASMDSVNLFVSNESRTDTNRHLVLQNGYGNVGIGNIPQPTEKLQIAGNIAPSTANTYTLGSATLPWKTLYLGTANSGNYITTTNTDYLSINGQGNEMTISGASNDLRINYRKAANGYAPTNIRINAGSADTWATLQTGTLQPGKTDTYDLGTSDLKWKNAYITNLNNLNVNAYRYEAFSLWGGQNLKATYSPIDAAMVGELGANRLAFGKAAGIDVLYSTDAGVTWIDYGASDSNKVALFSTSSAAFRIGKNTDKNVDFSKLQLKIRITTNLFGIYTTLNKFVIYVSTDGAVDCWCTIRGRTKANVDTGTDTWNTFAYKAAVDGWSGYNVINVSGITTYGNTSSQYQQLEFIFGASGSSSTYNGLVVCKIRGFGGVGWSTPSTMAASGNLYSYGVDQQAYFPNDIYSKNNLVLTTSNAFVTDIHNSEETTKTANAKQIWTECEKRNVQFIPAGSIDNIISNLKEEEFLRSYAYGVRWQRETSAITMVGATDLIAAKPIHNALRACVYKINYITNGFDVTENIDGTDYTVHYGAKREFLYWLDSEDWSKKEDGTASVINGTGDTGVAIYHPKFYGKSFDGHALNDIKTSGDYNSVYISSIKYDDTWSEIKEGFVDFAKATSQSGKARCYTGLTPSVSMPRMQMNNCALASGGHSMSYDEYKWLFYWLMVIDFGTFQVESNTIPSTWSWGSDVVDRDSIQDELTYGYPMLYSSSTLGYTYVKSGYTNALGTHTGWIKHTDSKYTANVLPVVRWRGYELQRDNWTNVQGCWGEQTNTGYNHIFATKNRALFSAYKNSNTYNPTYGEHNCIVKLNGEEIPVSSTINNENWSYDNETGLWKSTSYMTKDKNIRFVGKQYGPGYIGEFILNSTGDMIPKTLTSKKYDYNYVNLSVAQNDYYNPRFLIFGHRAASGANGGPSCLYSHFVASYSTGDVGFRVCWNADEYSSVMN